MLHTSCAAHLHLTTTTTPTTRAIPVQVHPSVGVAALDPNVGWDPADPAFAHVRRHHTSEVAWLEDDPGLSVPQLWVNRTLTHASEAARYGVTGLYGLLWRTAETAPQLAALGAAAWGVGPDVASATNALLPTDAGVMLSYAEAQFGSAAASNIASVMLSMDGFAGGPVPSNTTGAFPSRPTRLFRGGMACCGKLTVCTDDWWNVCACAQHGR
jgi:hypothetical protein